MGLDMYLISAPKIEGLDLDEILSAEYYINHPEEMQKEIYEKVKPFIKHMEEFGSPRIRLREDVAYWRKANQIHNWFVETLHDGIDEPCFTQEVTKENLQELYHLCEKVLTKIEHPVQFLPTRPGCFFGHLSYDDFYYNEIYETKSLLEYLLKHFNFETHYLFYQCSW